MFFSFDFYLPKRAGLWITARKNGLRKKVGFYRQKKNVSAERKPEQRSNRQNIGRGKSIDTATEKPLCAACHFLFFDIDAEEKCDQTNDSDNKHIKITEKVVLFPHFSYPFDPHVQVKRLQSIAVHIVYIIYYNAGKVKHITIFMVFTNPDRSHFAPEFTLPGKNKNTVVFYLEKNLKTAPETGFFGPKKQNMPGSYPHFHIVYPHFYRFYPHQMKICSLGNLCFTSARKRR